MTRLLLGACVGALLAGAAGAADAPTALSAGRWVQLYDQPGPDHDNAIGYAVAIVQQSIETGTFCSMHGQSGNGWAETFRWEIPQHTFYLRDDLPAWDWMSQYLVKAYPCGPVKPQPVPQKLGTWK